MRVTDIAIKHCNLESCYNNYEIVSYLTNKDNIKHLTNLEICFKKMLNIFYLV